ncbi:hypothetical protein FIBSPDRAFT_931419 [Athelia psychrophila]|uniref:Uncharacterized protein n=1 Tax=Athelia psychrophila TaxID=1759441 RepID=A0A166KDC2_9AGAM|nr:hypothetical protein FIBSPDRAFT_931419 [Fibularhizoctonia sp. CBS 109695]
MGSPAPIPVSFARALIYSSLLYSAISLLPSTSTGEKTAKRKFQTSSLLVDDDHHDGEAIGENTREWMDDELVGVVPQPNFSTVEQDADLDASELEDLLADRPRKDKGKGRAQEPDRIEETTDDEHSDEDDWDLA